MFIGHFALGLAAKRVAPQASLGALFVACQFADLLWPNLVLLGIETFSVVPGITAVTPLDFTFYPYSHSLLALVVWAVLAGALYRVVRKASLAATLAIGVLVLSHWVLDWIVHRPDLPLTVPGTTKYGVGLWQSVPATLLVEFGLYAIGVAVYARSTRALDRVGSIGFWSLVVFLGVIQLANVFGPPPPGVAAVAWTAQSMWLLVLWGHWVDRHRLPVRTTLA